MVADVLLLVGIIYISKGVKGNKHKEIHVEPPKAREIVVEPPNPEQENHHKLDKVAKDVQHVANQNFQLHNKNNRKKVKNINKNIPVKNYNIQQPSKRGWSD